MKKLCFITIVLFSVHALFAQEDTTLKEYTGVYKFPEGSIVPQIELVVSNGALVSNSSMGSTAFEKLFKDTFSIPQYNGMAYFTRNAEKQINGVRIEANDVILEGKKEGGSLHELIRVIQLQQKFFDQLVIRDDRNKNKQNCSRDNRPVYN